MDMQHSEASSIRQEVEQGHWYQDDLGQVFIVPDETFAAAEIEGPDGETLDRLNRIYRRCESEGIAFKKIDQAGIAKVLELHTVEASNRRFDTRTGRYFAERTGG